jgi:hypothetical protein
MLTRSSRAISSASVVFPEPWRSEEQRVIERFLSRQGRVDVNAQAVLDLLLADELSQTLRSERELDDRFVAQTFGSGDLGSGHSHTLPGDRGSANAKGRVQKYTERTPKLRPSIT